MPDVDMRAFSEKIALKLRSWSLFIGLLVGAFLISLLFVWMLFDLTDYGISFAAIGASVVMIFYYREDSQRTTYANLYTSYGIAAVCGYLGTLLVKESRLAAALALLTAIVAMVLLKKTHTPAIGMVISFVINKFSPWKMLLILLCIFAILFIAKTIKYILHRPEKFYIKIHTEKVKFDFRKKHNKKVLMNTELEMYD